ncbi:T9SS type A sorting domain-containing protein [Pedobacter sp. BS3]|uniref:T9SS type A sorting domain-containing protein n=1 Tax=Pedobacter sp. BS3 TaxID=2567937 RepID=UPI0011EF5670|nr:T9SS type A sorting domain-containing protein [Pedobacter sp. BS3]TZF82065.1 T9SS type A sorting domain-containing protein [Pedobacter sp. BS3]
MIGNYTLYIRRSLSLFLLLIPGLNGKAQQLAFPGAEGFGKNTTGGRGGTVIKVTNLNDSGDGSLRKAIEATGTRTIVFEVSGNIKLTKKLQIKNGNVTIAGQTAPGDGICIQDYEMNIAADNVIIRYMRFRLGDKYDDQSDALWGRDHQNIIIDHCSMSWSIDETSSFYNNKNFTMQWCILAESLNDSGHDKGIHGYGAIWGGTNATFHHNLLACHLSRSPRFNGGPRAGIEASGFGADLLNYSNNVVYNWGDNSSYGGENGHYDMVNNYYKAGPGTASSKRSRLLEVYFDNSLAAPGYGQFYIAGNYIDGSTTVTANNWAGVSYKTGATEAQVKVNTAFTNDGITLQTAQDAYASVLANAGAIYPKRDAVDTRIMNEVETGTVTVNGSLTGRPGLIDSQTDVGGWPVLNSTAAPADTDNDGMPDDWEISHGLNPNDAADRNTINVDGYTMLEVYLNAIGPNNTILPLNLVSFTAAVNNGLQDAVTLKWITAAERNTQRFTVERSADGKEFTSIGQIQAQNTAGTNHYQFTDSHPVAGTAYYRLKITDTDGSFIYGKVIEANVKNKALLLVYPNPVNGQLTINYPIAGKNAIVKIRTVNGSVQRVQPLAAGTHQTSIDVSALAAGTYILQVYTGTEKQTIQFIKQQIN